MRTNAIRRVTLAAVAAIVFLPSLLGHALAQIRPEERQYDPLHAGLGSQGGQPDLQSPDPTFFFEEKANWAALRKQIPDGEPRTAWEYAQRGMYRQDELEDVDAAVADYKKSESLSSRLLIVQARLGVIALKEGRRLDEAGQYSAALESLDEAIEHFEHILEESPFHQGIPFLLGETYELRYEALEKLGRAEEAAQALAKAEEEFERELKLAPASQRTHFALAQLLLDEGRGDDAIVHLETYLCQAKLHSDPILFRILKARKQRNDLVGNQALDCAPAQAAAR